MDSPFLRFHGSARSDSIRTPLLRNLVDHQTTYSPFRRGLGSLVFRQWFGGPIGFVIRLRANDYSPKYRAVTRVFSHHFFKRAHTLKSKPNYLRESFSRGPRKQTMFKGLMQLSKFPELYVSTELESGRDIQTKKFT